ncbi:MAG: rubrerythrin [Desulfobacterium sp.]|nr:rubrerythrin [Desulfobacterium sp.]
MNSQDIFKHALTYEKKIRDLYRSAVETIDDKRGKAIFKALADDEQSHVDFLEYSLDLLASAKEIDIEKLGSAIPVPVEDHIKQMKEKIPEQMLGDVKRVLNAALVLEIETSKFYKKACGDSQGRIKEILEKFYEIEQRHVAVVQIELDQATGSGFWFGFMEKDMED